MTPRLSGVFSFSERPFHMKKLKKTALFLFIIIAGASLCCLSVLIKSGNDTFAACLVCVIAFWAASGFIIAVYITNREKPLIFPALYIAVIAAAILIPLAVI